jgi:hypothetical protein
MNTETFTRRHSLLPSAVVFLVVLAVLIGAFLFGRGRANRGLHTAFEDALRKQQLVWDMQVRLLASAEAEKSSVMADTDEASATFAQAARRESAAVEEDRQELARLIEIGGQSDEMSLFRDFTSSWTRYQELDRELLGLAVENTNLKALRLTFGPASEALDRMEAACDDVAEKAGTSNEADTIIRSASQGLTAALKIHALQFRHIAEARDEEMEKIEAQMESLDAQVNGSLNLLSDSVDPNRAADVDAARNAYAEFQEVHKQVLDLSRRNSNIQSVAISLGEKRKAMARCLELLHALEDLFVSERRQATR